jgi:hypothetical protein
VHLWRPSAGTPRIPRTCGSHASGTSRAGRTRWPPGGARTWRPSDVGDEIAAVLQGRAAAYYVDHQQPMPPWAAQSPRLRRPRRAGPPRRGLRSGPGAFDDSALRLGHAERFVAGHLLARAPTADELRRLQLRALIPVELRLIERSKVDHLLADQALEAEHGYSTHCSPATERSAERTDRAVRRARSYRPGARPGRARRCSSPLRPSPPSRESWCSPGRPTPGTSHTPPRGCGCGISGPAGRCPSAPVPERGTTPRPLAGAAGATRRVGPNVTRCPANRPCLGQGDEPMLKPCGFSWHTDRPWGGRRASQR